MSNIRREKVTHVHHWTERLFSFRTTRDPGFRYTNGQFTMIGLEVDGKPLLRAYSMVSANYEDELEFLSIKVPDGPLTSRLQHIKVGDTVLVGTKPVGTLVQDSLLPGRHLYLLSTGTGLAPFMSIIRDPEAYSRYEKIVLVHGCREVAELAYADYISRDLPDHEFLGDLVRDKLSYYTTVTREKHTVQGRITTLMETGKMFSDLGLQKPRVEDDRFMLCGSPDMLTDATRMLESWGFHEGASNDPRHYVIEKAFVEK